MLETALTIIIDPSYEAYYQDRLFDMSDPVLNRDGALEPFGRLRNYLKEQGVEVHTADHLLNDESDKDYYSFGLLKNYPKLSRRNNIRLRGFIIMEPPILAPHLYLALPELTATFEHVYVHNTIGDGYSLKGVDQSKLRSYFWPQPHKDVLEPFWSRGERLRRIVAISSSHLPRSFPGEMYSTRIDAMVCLAKHNAIDLYGHGWGKWWSRESMWSSYWRNRVALMSIYRGTCRTKSEVLSQYCFSLCFENTEMKGYVTEKIFDCLYAGTIPLYLGAKDIETLITPDAYVDCRQFRSWDEMRDKIMSMTDDEIDTMREVGRAFIRGERGLKYYNSLIEIVRP